MNHKQLNAKLMLSTVMCLFVLMHVPVTDCTSYTPPPTIYVSGSGNGDFNCGSNNADIQINQALQFAANNPEYTPRGYLNMNARTTMPIHSMSELSSLCKHM